MIVVTDKSLPNWEIRNIGTNHSSQISKKPGLKGASLIKRGGECFGDMKWSLMISPLLNRI